LGYFALPFTIFAVVGATNALNLSDGLDGLAGSLSVVMLACLLFIGITYNDDILICLPLLLMAPLLAFLKFNWHPAKVFMGDSGSLFLGFTIALLCIYALKYINPSSVLFLMAIPILDTLMVMKRRKQRKQSMLVADKNHLHHILLSFKKNKTFTVKSLIKLQIAFGLIFIQVYDKSDLINLILFIILFFTFFNLFDPRISYREIKKLQKKKSIKEATTND
jgi:UDP-GlcNAc:undecaprenyl-phosphate GlcNAc-1-phosphate transferase